MTDKADKVHPHIEAMARAVLAKRTGIPDCYDNTRSWAEETDDAMERRCKAQGYGRSVQQTQVENREYERRSLAALHDEMKAAAKVLLSMEATPEMQGAAERVWDGRKQARFAAVFRAMTSRAREEMGV